MVTALSSVVHIPHRRGVVGLEWFSQVFNGIAAVGGWSALREGEQLAILGPLKKVHQNE
jgi:hypothetical protein